MCGLNFPVDLSLSLFVLFLSSICGTLDSVDQVLKSPRTFSFILLANVLFVK